MHPQNIACITAAKIDCCALAKNHVLDCGYAGLTKTLERLNSVKVKSAGAGRDAREAQQPTIVDIPGKGRVLIFACGAESSGIPRSWGAEPDRAGVNLLSDLSTETVRRIKEHVSALKRGGDLVVASIHWGATWEYAVPREQTLFAHELIDNAGVDIIHGHSSQSCQSHSSLQGKANHLRLR
jgi:poly-gamma-glutamate capsule biosynthesis protein CapA/YwtB (metallophosphatase superfamily)